MLAGSAYIMAYTLILTLTKKMHFEAYADVFFPELSNCGLSPKAQQCIRFDTLRQHGYRETMDTAKCRVQDLDLMLLKTPKPKAKHQSCCWLVAQSGQLSQTRHIMRTTRCAAHLARYNYYHLQLNCPATGNAAPWRELSCLKIQSTTAAEWCQPLVKLCGNLEILALDNFYVKAQDLSDMLHHNPQIRDLRIQLDLDQKDIPQLTQHPVMQRLTRLTLSKIRGVEAVAAWSQYIATNPNLRFVAIDAILESGQQDVWQAVLQSRDIKTCRTSQYNLDGDSESAPNFHLNPASGIVSVYVTGCSLFSSKPRVSVGVQGTIRLVVNYFPKLRRLAIDRKYYNADCILASVHIAHMLTQLEVFWGNMVAFSGECLDIIYQSMASDQCRLVALLIYSRSYETIRKFKRNFRRMLAFSTLHTIYDPEATDILQTIMHNRSLAVGANTDDFWPRYNRLTL